jgi:hypothetical protein
MRVFEDQLSTGAESSAVFDGTGHFDRVFDILHARKKPKVILIGSHASQQINFDREVPATSTRILSIASCEQQFCKRPA